MTAPDIELSPAQAKAVDSDAAAIVVSAGAGSGKTEVVARRVERLLAQDPAGASRILAVSYTVKAADEMHQRLRSRIADVDRRVDCETIHGFAHALLRREGTWVELPVEPQVIAEDHDRAELLRSWLESQGEALDPVRILEILHEIDLARARRADAPYLAEWREALADRGAVDYPAMIDKALEVLALPATSRQLRRIYRHVIVDEAQNLTPAQYALLTSLAGPPPLSEPSVVLVGDGNQSIVEFAGADPKLMRRFADDYEAEEIPLDDNFRCARRIQAVADAVAAELGREPRSPSHAAAEGVVESLDWADEQAEGQGIASWIASLLTDGLPPSALAPGEDPSLRPEDIAVLGRSGASLRQVTEALDELGIPRSVAVRSEDWVTTPHAGALVALMAWHVGDDFVPRRTLAKILDQPEADLPDVGAVIQAMRERGGSWKSLADIAAAEHPTQVIDRLREVDFDESDQERADWDDDLAQIDQAWQRYCLATDHQDRSWGGFRMHLTKAQRASDLTDGVRLVTIHKAQGREFRAVAVVGLNDGQLPDFRAKDPDARRAELRTFYVAVSRPSRVLLLSRSRERATRSGPWRTQPSPFLEFLPIPG